MGKANTAHTAHTVRLRSLEPFAQQSRYGISPDAFSALMMPASELHQDFSNLAPYLDFSLTKPASALWAKLTSLSNEGVTDNGFDVESACAFQRHIDSVRNSIDRLSPVLCPKLSAKMAEAHMRLTESAYDLLAWCRIYTNAHRESMTQSMPEQSIDWRVRIAASPAYFSLQADELKTFKTVAIRLPHNQVAHVAVDSTKPIRTVKDLLNLVSTACKESELPIKEVYRLGSADGSKTCLQVFAR